VYLSDSRALAGDSHEFCFEGKEYDLGEDGDFTLLPTPA